MKTFSILLVAAALSVLPALAQEGVRPPALTENYNRLITGEGPRVGMALVRNGNEAANTLGGTELGDLFRGAGGDDVLIGGRGRDVYLFHAGDGADTIIDHGEEGNTLRFHWSVDPGTVGYSEVPGYEDETDRLVTYGDGEDAIRIVGWSRLGDEVRAAWTTEFVAAPPRRETPNDIVLWRLSAFLPFLTLAAATFLAVWGFRRLPRR